MIDPKIFKRYDIRGKYPDEINPEISRLLVDAYVRTFKPDKIVIGHDPLEGSKTIYTSVCDQFALNGIDVYQAGETSTPMLYFASAFYSVPQGIMLTASHLGVGHTGFKGVIDGVPPSQEQMKEMSEIVNELEALPVSSKKKGNLIPLDELYVDYINKIKDLVPPLNNPVRYNFVFDVSNGPNAHVIDLLAKHLKLDYKLINSVIKGENLAHDTNPKIQENREQLVAEVKRENAEIGVIWDGDGDRAYFIDKDGEVIAPEFVGSHIGKYLIKNKKGTTMTLDVRGSAAVEQELRAVGGNVLRIQAWHVPIKFEMEKDSNIVFGMETSGHYVFRDMFKADDGLLASLMFIKALDDEEKELSQLLQEFRSKYKIVEEINFETPKSEEQLVQEFKQLYPDAKVIDIDGVTIEFPDWRFNIRSSRTEPIIRLNISGSNFEKVSENLKLLIMQIGGRML